MIALFEQFLTQALRQQPDLQAVLNLLLCLLKKTDFAEQMPGFVKLTMRSLRLEEDHPHLADFVC